MEFNPCNIETNQNQTTNFRINQPARNRLPCQVQLLLSYV